MKETLNSINEIPESIKASEDERKDLLNIIYTLTEYEYDKMCAIVELENYTSATHIFNMLDNFDDWEYLWDAETSARLGFEFAERNEIAITDDFDYEKYGEEIAEQLKGIFSMSGFVYKIS